VSISPAEIRHTGTYYGVYPLTITATASSVAPESVSLQFLDKDTGIALGSVPVVISVAETAGQGSPSEKPHNCTTEDTSGCTEKELVALQMGPNFIEQNQSDLYLLVGIFAAFAAIALIFFVVLPRK
jgi:hypothetical protein